MGNRKAATAEAVKLINMLLPGSKNGKLWQERLDKLTDTQFDTFMQKLASGEECLSLISPNLDDHKLDLQRNLDIATKIGHKFFQKLWLTDAASGTTYLTPKKYLVIDLPIRRQQQLLQKKIKIPVDTHHIDELTGQPRDESKGSSVTFPEVQVLAAQDATNLLEEMLKIRGGDEKGRQSMERQILQTGHASLATIKRVPSRPKSTETLSALLSGMHLKNNL